MQNYIIPGYGQEKDRQGNGSGSVIPEQVVACGLCVLQHTQSCPCAKGSGSGCYTPHQVRYCGAGKADNHIKS